MKKLCLTAITGNYDQLLTPRQRAEGWDYICMTDDPELKSDFWQVQPIPDEVKNHSAVRKSRYVKVMAPDLFPNYDVILWVDGNQLIIGDINEFYENYKNADFVGNLHLERNCIYEEADAVINLKKDSPGVVKRQIKKLESEGFPPGYGLHEVGVSIRKNTETVRAFCRKWWQEVEENSYRDQLSFDYVRWLFRDEPITYKWISLEKRERYFHRIRVHKGTLTEGIDVVYPLGSGSSWGDNELRYSIRSVVEHFKNLRQIVIVGRKPRWLTRVLHIPVEDDQKYKDANIIKKLLAACRHTEVSDQFIYAADDKFMLEDMGFNDLQGWHYGRISRTKGGTIWNNWNVQTAEELVKRGLPDNDYNKAHAFQPVDKKEFIDIIGKYDWHVHFYLASNIYNNSTEKFKGKNARKIHRKIHESLDHAQILRKIDKAKSFNINDEGLNDAMKETLKVLFPNQCFVELYGHDKDPWAEYNNWLENRDFQEGIRFLERNTRNGQLIRFFRKKGETPRTRKIMEKNLFQIAKKYKP